MLKVAAFRHVRSQKYYPPRVTSRNGDYHKLYRFSEENVQWLGEHFLEHNQETTGCKYFIYLFYLKISQ
jgi:hypothetical protein